ncbi:hypothetical protein [Actinomycetospora chiangmaiensis]|uniref:hypothetical protein n=1 Tax=Actinomycetospora chiangmaiensis TaxID=402650 RepID=UPI001FE0F2FF|nr:hypothetical protein [Actinomycetospora chiangmaiensis]
MLRKTVLATAIIGAGLGSMSGAALAWDNHGGHDAAKGCSNDLSGKSENGAGRTLGDTTGGDQTFDASNTCDILNGNKVLSDNNAATGGSTIRNGNDRTETRTTNTASQSTSNTTIPVLGGLLP